MHPASLDLHTSREHPQEVGHGGYVVRLLRLDPYPVTGSAIAAEVYCAILAVRRGADPTDERRWRLLLRAAGRSLAVGASRRARSEAG